MEMHQANGARINLLTSVPGRAESRLVPQARAASFRDVRRQIGDAWNITSVEACVLSYSCKSLQSYIMIDTQEEWSHLLYQNFYRDPRDPTPVVSVTLHRKIAAPSDSQLEVRSQLVSAPPPARSAAVSVKHEAVDTPRPASAALTTIDSSQATELLSLRAAYSAQSEQLAQSIAAGKAQAQKLAELQSVSALETQAYEGLKSLHAKLKIENAAQLSTHQVARLQLANYNLIHELKSSGRLFASSETSSRIQRDAATAQLTKERKQHSSVKKANEALQLTLTKQKEDEAVQTKSLESHMAKVAELETEVGRLRKAGEASAQRLMSYRLAQKICLDFAREKTTTKGDLLELTLLKMEHLDKFYGFAAPQQQQPEPVESPGPNAKRRRGCSEEVLEDKP